MRRGSAFRPVRRKGSAGRTRPVLVVPSTEERCIGPTARVRLSLDWGQYTCARTAASGVQLQGKYRRCPRDITIFSWLQAPATEPPRACRQPVGSRKRVEKHRRRRFAPARRRRELATPRYEIRNMVEVVPTNSFVAGPGASTRQTRKFVRSRESTSDATPATYPIHPIHNATAGVAHMKITGPR